MLLKKYCDQHKTCKLVVSVAENIQIIPVQKK